MEFKNNEAIYMQIADYISEQILLGRWAAQEKIPSVRELSGNLEVNPNTVMRSYDQLQQAEIIFNKRGIGFFVSAEAVPLIKQHQRDRFLNEELPVFFRKIHLLGISIDDLQLKYQHYLSEKENENQ